LKNMAMPGSATLSAELAVTGSTAMSCADHS